MTKEQRRLRERIDLICRAVERAEASRLLARFRERGPEEVVLEAMRRAIEKVDGGLNVTTDALAAALKAALTAYAKKRAPRGTPEDQ